MVTDQAKKALQRSCTCTTLRKATRRLSQMFDEALAPVGLKTTQAAVLTELSQRADAPPSVQDLADALVIERGGLSHALRPLERAGFVAVRSDRADRRRRCVMLTAKGRAVEREATAALKEAEERFGKLYGLRERHGLIAALSTIALDDRFGRLRDSASA
jgi:DNA-binding MarR family transcriptional regulator